MLKQTSYDNEKYYTIRLIFCCKHMWVHNVHTLLVCPLDGWCEGVASWWEWVERAERSKQKRTQRGPHMARNVLRRGLHCVVWEGVRVRNCGGGSSLSCFPWTTTADDEVFFRSSVCSVSLVSCVRPMFPPQTYERRMPTHVWVVKYAELMQRTPPPYLDATETLTHRARAGKP